jgi:rRNA-processing protein FCF1
VPRAATPDPLHGTDRLLVDGTNLLHALRREPGAMPPAAVIGRLRGVVPATVGIELVLDGTPDRGMRGNRIASGLIVRYAGQRSADEVLVSLVDEARSAAGGSADAVDNVLVVTDDRELREGLRRRGVRTAGTRWLIGRLDRGRLAAPATGNRSGPSIGNRRTPGVGSRGGTAGSAGAGSRSDSAGQSEGHGNADVADEPGWQPGRGATTKRGNPKRRPKGSIRT